MKTALFLFSLLFALGVSTGASFEEDLCLNSDVHGHSLEVLELQSSPNLTFVDEVSVFPQDTHYLVYETDFDSALKADIGMQPNRHVEIKFKDPVKIPRITDNSLEPTQFSGVAAPYHYLLC